MLIRQTRAERIVNGRVPRSAAERLSVQAHGLMKVAIQVAKS